VPSTNSKTSSDINKGLSGNIGFEIRDVCHYKSAIGIKQKYLSYDSLAPLVYTSKQVHNSAMNKNLNRYTQVKNYVLAGISDGSWGSGERVPSENELVDLCDVSRMTARRALQELLLEGTLIRIKGKGSYVAEEKQQSSLLQIRSIAAEIKEQGFEHHAEMLQCSKELASPISIKKLRLNEDDYCGHSRILHFQDNTPIQLEERWVNLKLIPEYTEQDFKLTTPSEYLTSVAPVTEAEHSVEAVMGDVTVRQLLEVEDNEALLLLERKTWCNGKLVSYARLYHPGNSYRLGTKFKTI